MISLIFFFLAAICNAMMDTLSHHFETSIFKNLNPKWWNPNVSWRYVKLLPFTKYRPDAWHLLKSLMLIFLALAVSSNLLTFILAGIGWILVFNLFYNKLLRDA